MSITFHNTITNKGKFNPYPGKEPYSDICLLLEGTYPFVPGGVSSWVHSLIQGLPDLSFQLFVILPDNKKRKLAYPIPSNVTGLYLHQLHHSSFLKKAWFQLPKKEDYLSKIVAFHHQFPDISPEFELENYLNGPLESSPEMIRKIAGNTVTADLMPLLKQLIDLFEKQNRDIPSRIISRKAWEVVKTLYREKKLNCSFVDYFWTWRYLHFGIFSVMHAYIPKAGLYHAVSTGYAGLAGARAHFKYNAPLVLTEHGIYNKERKIDISRSPWIYEERRHLFRTQENLETFKELWIKAFTIMSGICYQAASCIITLYTGNQPYQIQDGANPEIMQVIPNGIDVAKLSNLRREPQPNKIIGFVGRIVPIKDVKTFLRAVSIVFRSYPDAEAWLMGPTDENEQYFQECLQLVEFLEIRDKVRFSGMVDLQHFYPKLDVMVLTSISEAQPLVILEAFALGIPVVATDVGACRELIEGGPGDDIALGKAGLVTGMTNPAETAFSILHLLLHPEEAEKMGVTGRERVKTYYDLPKLFDRYQQLYQHFLNPKQDNGRYRL